MINGWKVLDCHGSLIPSDESRCKELSIVFRPKAGGRSYRDTTVEAHLERMDRLGIDKTIVWSNADDNEICKARNDFISESMKLNPDRFIGFANVYPLDESAALRELDRAINKLGLKGLKLHSIIQHFNINDPSFLKIVKEVRNLDIPLVMHVDGTFLDGEAPFTPEIGKWSKPEHLPAVIEVYDSPKVMAAHMGGVFIPEVAASSITFQTTGASKMVIEQALSTVGVERIVWGSDFPSFSVEDELAKILDNDLTDEEKELILGRNLETRVLS